MESSRQMMLESKPPKLSIVVWSDFSDEQIQKLEELTDSESINKFFMKILHFEPNTKRTTILCDLFYYAFNFARTNKFNHEQISTFLSIIKRVHEMCICTPFANMEETYQYFKVLVLKHSLSRPPFFLRILTPDITKKVTDYVVDTYFRHYKMYKYIFTSTVDFNLKFIYEGMSVEKKDDDNEHSKIATQSDENINQQQTIEEQQRQSQLMEVRKLVEIYVKEEVRKIQSTTEQLPVPRTPADKRRSAKSNSTKSSKPRTPK